MKTETKQVIPAYVAQIITDALEAFKAFHRILALGERYVWESNQRDKLATAYRRFMDVAANKPDDIDLEQVCKDLGWTIGPVMALEEAHKQAHKIHVSWSAATA